LELLGGALRQQYLAKNLDKYALLLKWDYRSLPTLERNGVVIFNRAQLNEAVVAIRERGDEIPPFFRAQLAASEEIEQAFRRRHLPQESLLDQFNALDQGQPQGPASILDQFNALP